MSTEFALFNIFQNLDFVDHIIVNNQNRVYLKCSETLQG